MQAAEKSVGLLPGFSGNSEVGHLTIGSGCILPSSLKRMHELTHQNGLSHHKEWQVFLKEIVRDEKRLHFLGLLSDGGVHAHEDHLYALMRSAHAAGVKEILIHAWLDGRDVSPRSAQIYLQKLDLVCQELGNASIVSIAGRLYAMDRDKHYDRTDQVVAAITKKTLSSEKNWRDVIDEAYEFGDDDQYIKPELLNAQGVISPEDALFFFNIRPERTRQIIERLCDSDQGGTSFSQVMSSVSYWEVLPSWAPSTLLDRVTIESGLLASINRQAEKDDFKIVTIAESEKQMHVGYYLHGNNSSLCSREKQIIIPSLKQDSYADAPAMSAEKITEEVIKQLQDEQVGFIVVNYANADMVAHSGDFDATVAACELLDDQLKKIIEYVDKRDGILVLTADHGNAEEMIDEKTGEKRTSHTKNDVIFLIASKYSKGKVFDQLSIEQLPVGLSLIAPTILSLQETPIEDEMEKPLLLV
ncbi:phosphoglycerate mutase (2,3-diphosphoglycerate-independent) [Candidatus Babeliales bacterium]|nr:phosphoglycerate mutase (2,3-diphosphoglycerate-independent) [Candidatus Babeliales bacterium]